MGFGLTMTAILLSLDYAPKEIVPSLLLSSLMGNNLISFFNHRLKNAPNFRLSPSLCSP